MKRANITATVIAVLLALAGYHLGAELLSAMDSYFERTTARAVAEMGG